MKKYGLQLRPAQNKKPPRPPLATAPIFRDNDDDNVEQEIARQATKTKSLKDVEVDTNSGCIINGTSPVRIKNMDKQMKSYLRSQGLSGNLKMIVSEEQHKKALEEDPSVFDYDGVNDEMKQKIALPKAQEREERRPKYIQALMKKQEQRQREQDMIYERKIAKERSKEDHLYAGKDKFVTSAYKKKLAEQEKWMKEEQLRQLQEEKEDVTKKKDLSDFYFNLEKNVAFGAEDVKSRKQEKQSEIRKPEKQTEVVKPEKLTEFMKPVKQDDEVSADVSLRRQLLTESRLGSECPQVKDRPPAESSIESPSFAAQPKDDGHHKRSQDAIAAAKERFLAWKKSKVMI